MERNSCIQYLVSNSVYVYHHFSNKKQIKRRLKLKKHKRLVSALDISDDGLLVYSIFPLELVTMKKNHPLIKSIVDNESANELFILDKI